MTHYTRVHVSARAPVHVDRRIDKKCNNIKRLFRDDQRREKRKRPRLYRVRRVAVGTLLFYASIEMIDGSAASVDFFRTIRVSLDDNNTRIK